MLLLAELSTVNENLEKIQELLCTMTEMLEANNSTVSLRYITERLCELCEASRNEE